MNSARPAWREPMLWLVVGIPALCLVGGGLTLRAALATGQSDTVPEEVRHSAQVQDADLAPDMAAARQGLQVQLHIDESNKQVWAEQVAGIALAKQPIELNFVHPLRADHDSTIRLMPMENRWQGALPSLPKSDWRLVLCADDGSWRLVGRLPGDARRAVLIPSVSP